VRRKLESANRTLKEQEDVMNRDKVSWKMDVIVQHPQEELEEGEVPHSDQEN